MVITRDRLRVGCMIAGLAVGCPRTLTWAQEQPDSPETSCFDAVGHFRTQPAYGFERH